MFFLYNGIASSLDSRKDIRCLLALLASFSLVGCAVTQESQPISITLSPEPPLATFDQWLGSYRSLSDSQDDQAQNLEITREPRASSPSETRRYLWTQWGDGDQDNPRRFVLVLVNDDEGLSSSFMPLTQRQSTNRSCPIDWQLTSKDGGAAIVGLTVATECRFSSPDGELGLVKEWSFDGQHIEVADQLIDLDTGELQQVAQRLEFVRIARYNGWAAVKEAGEWRVDEAFWSLSDGQRRAARDAAGMPLGLAVTLERRQAPAHAGASANSNLHLVVSDATTGEVFGQAWASSEASRIGWANENFQIELTRDPIN